ncbi:MAG TPA: energy transducer TonB [Terracidiphilus sp.]|nr:energy transducer TonB [Terracidiphilus sp.]
MKNSVLSQGAFTVQTVGGEIKEDQLKLLLVGKTMYLRAGYQENNLEFDEHGRLQGHSPQGSFTLSQIQINKVKLSKRKLELEGDRYALHFLGAAPYEDPTAATDRVKITPKKKSVRIYFVREEVEKPKKKDKSENKKQKHHAKNEDTETAGNQPSSAGSDISDSASPSTPGDHQSDKKGTAAASETQASQLLLSALDTVFSVGIDERMIATMPEFWKLYYQAAAEKTDYKPADPGVLRQSVVDQKARLISALDPPSNEFAQANGVAGIALYHAVIGSDGKVEAVVAGRPIGFGLDESADQTIRKATFQPAMKDGKPVPVTLDVVVSFRIYSKRTSQQAATDTGQKPESPALPGPYTVQSETAQASSAVH